MKWYLRRVKHFDYNKIKGENYIELGQTNDHFRLITVMFAIMCVWFYGTRSFKRFFQSSDEPDTGSIAIRFLFENAFQSSPLTGVKTNSRTNNYLASLLTMNTQINIMNFVFENTMITINQLKIQNDRM